MEQKPRNLLDEVSPEDLEKVKAHKASTAGSMPVDTEWMIATEWLKLAGWQGYLAYKNDEITLAEMLTLIEANRRLEYRKMFDASQTSFIGSISSQSKKPANTFKALTKAIIKRTKADE